MSEIPRTEKVDIWMEAVRTIVGYHKRTLLDFIDTIGKNVTQQEKERFGRIKGRVHNDLSQCALSLGILIETYRVGGNIDSFKGSMLDSRPHENRPHDNRPHYSKPTINKKQSQPVNPVLSKEKANAITNNNNVDK